MTYRSKIAVVFLLGFFLDLINMFIASVAFPAMARAFNTTPSALAWVSNGYIAGLTLVIPFSSILTRRVGPKRVILLSLLLFSAASVAAGLSSSLESLIAWRVVQGAGGGLLIPVGQALTWQQFKPHERARLSSAVMLVALLAPACSPAVGGMLVQTFSWRWIFFATLPVVIVTFALACAWLKTEPSPITPTRTVNLSLLTDPLLRLSMLIYVCVPGIFIGVNVTGMYYLQSEANMTPAATGMLMLPWSVASFLAITATGRYFNRIGPRPLVVIGCLLQATGILLLVNVGPAMLLPAVAFALMGAGGKPLQQYGSEQRVFDDATGRYARCQRAMESQSSVELFCGRSAAGAGAELHAGLSLAAGRLARDVCFCRSHHSTARTVRLPS